ncbi:RES family NAD+ phosphorylase [Gluconacetobacter asukensis]|uniref:RES family NAD+ phosphorylase n=1 Tax=Gluconacetobacter asukensis TaxID=1017181 RepID=A0A7W4J310_9PROT|nr:RES family NAD+ phosphorylase [Gluconacetobacter asukensis]MBB2173739.1 RES family NAD+ phosphorylase [Gluconacetobacter asukensis]
MKRTVIQDRALIRLISATYHKPPALRGLVDSDAEMEVLARIEGLTSARQRAEEGHSLSLDNRELSWQRRNNGLTVYGNSHINAAFTYARTGGSRFNTEQRGAWYCVWSVETALAEVAFHRTRELEYIGIFNNTARYVEMHADFIGEFPDITDEPDHPCLHPDPAIGYLAGQKLATELQHAGERGLIYPSVRQPGGRCFVVFDPSAIQNVRPGASWDLTWAGSRDYVVNGV